MALWERVGEKQVVLGGVLSILALVRAFRQVELSQVVAAFAGAHYGLMSLGRSVLPDGAAGVEGALRARDGGAARAPARQRFLGAQPAGLGAFAQPGAAVS